MILTKLTLHNFGIYAGRHEINLAPKRGKPIILIGALNGSGKTTLLEGIQFALFGKFSKFLDKSKSAYIDFLTNSINRRNLENSASVSLEFFLNKRGDKQKYEVTRTWLFKNNGIPNESIQVTLNDELSSELSERWVEISETIFPSQLSDLFFFDGERIESLAQPARCSELIRTGLNSLLGLDLVNDLNKTLITLERRLKSEVISESEKEEFKKLLSKISDVESDISLLTYESKQVTEKKVRLFQTLEELRIQLQQQGGDLYVQRDQLAHRHNNLIVEIDNKRNELVEISASVLPLCLLDDLMKDAESHSMNGLTSSQKEVVKESLETFSVNIFQELSLRNEFTDAQIELIKSIHITLLAINTKENNYPEINLSRESIFRNRTESSIKKLNSLQLLLELGKFNTELDQIEKHLLAVPNAEKLAPLFHEIKLIEEEIRKNEISEKSLDDQKSKKGRELDSLNTKSQKFLEEEKKYQANELLHLKMKEQLVTGRKALNLFEEKIRTKHLKTLEDLIKDGIKLLLRKKSLIKSIAICPNTFQLTLNVVGKGLVPSSKLSAGERQLLAVSVLWALAKTSRIKLPTVIDTPLGRLDSNHRNTFVEKYFPKAGEQVILLSTDEEIIGQYYESIKGHLSHEYLIEYDDTSQSSNITTGYFKPNRQYA